MKTGSPVPGTHRCQPGDAADRAVAVDDEFASLIPPPTPAELADLHASLDADGCRDPLTVWKGHGLLLDGHNRLRHCRARGLPYPVRELAFAARADAAAFVVALQLGRRNLAPVAEAYFRGKRYLAQKRQGRRTDLDPGHVDQKSSARQIGAELHVGEKTVRRDAKLAQAVDRIVEHCGLEARNLLLARASRCTRAGLLALAALTPAEQRRRLQQLRQGGKTQTRRGKGGKRSRLSVPGEPKALAATLLEKMNRKQVVALWEALGAALGQSAKEPGE